MSYLCMANKSARDSEDGERISNWENEGGALGSLPDLERPQDGRKDVVAASPDSKKSIVGHSHRSLSY